MRVLITTVELEARGGIAGFYRSLQGKFHVEADYCVVGSRQEDERPVRVLVRLLTDTWRYFRLLRTGGFDLVLLNTSLTLRGVLRDGGLLLLARMCGVPAIVFFHGWLDSLSEKIRRSYRSPFLFVYGRAAAFVVLTSGVRQQLKDLGLQGPTYQINTFADELFFRDDERRIERQHLRDTGDGFVILFLSRIDIQKGIYEAVQAFGLLAAKYPGVKFVVAGDGIELEHVEKFVRDRGMSGISFVGHLDGEDKLRAFQHADAYFLPSYTEGMPLSVLEAMSCGLPVITRPVGALKDFFQDGAMGFITESKDPHVLASLLERLIVDPSLCASMGDHNRRYAAEHFRSDAVVEDLERIFSRVLDPSGARAVGHGDAKIIHG